MKMSQTVFINIANKDKVNQIIESTKFKTEKYGTVVIFTNGNDWYIQTLIYNLLKSMDIYESDRKIIVFCSDQAGYKKCSDLSFKYFEFVDIPDLEVSNALSGSDSNTKNYTRLSFVKIVLMKHILEMGYTPLYLDPDMAFLKPSIDDLLCYLDRGDFVCAGTRNYLNSNIMLARPCENTKKLFELPLERFNKIVYGKDTYGDEDLLRPRLINKPFICIDRKDYPPGCDAVKYKNVARIIHSNCVVGLNNKIQLMKDCDAWFLDRDIYSPLISPEFMVEVKDIYPPFLSGELFETYFYYYVQKHHPKLARSYINVSWTNLYCNSQFKGIPYNSIKLQQELDVLPENGRYFTIVQFDEGIRHRIPKNTVVFGCCAGEIPIPLTYENPELFSSIKKKSWNEKNILCSFLGKPTHSLRQKVYNYVKQFPDYFYHVPGNYDKKMYINKCVDSKFCLAPRGFGRSSFRFFEVLKFGSIPVYIWDDKNWSPFKNLIDYSRLCITLNIADIDKLDGILRSITKEQYEQMLAYHEKIKHLFTYDGMCQEIIRTVNKSIIIHSSAGLGDQLMGFASTEVLVNKLGANTSLDMELFDSPNCPLKIKDEYKVSNVPYSHNISLNHRRDFAKQLFRVHKFWKDMSSTNVTRISNCTYNLDGLDNSLFPIYFKNCDEALVEIQKAMRRFFTRYTVVDPAIYRRISHFKGHSKLVVLYIQSGDDRFMMGNVRINQWPVLLITKLRIIFSSIAQHIQQHHIPNSKFLLLSDLNTADIHRFAYKYLDQENFHPHSSVENTHSQRQNLTKQQWYQILDDFICIGSADQVYTTENSNFSRAAIILGNNGQNPDYFFVSKDGLVQQSSHLLLNKGPNSI